MLKRYIEMTVRIFIMGKIKEYPNTLVQKIILKNFMKEKAIDFFNSILYFHKISIIDF